ncbi:MAG: type II secretion system protein [Candidatus Doudnabacteria bacterium]|nr:type II secretion system protein [Candidatus Doudnabacteria bacterium]
MRNQKQINNLRHNVAYPGADQDGFTLIELMVVVAIIALLASIALIAAMSGQAKSRDAKRLADMTQMNTGLNLYFSSFYGYPTTTGVPTPLIPTYIASAPNAPMPPDGACGQTSYPPPVPGNVMGGTYYYLPTGTEFLAPDGITQVYSSYDYYFCLGAQTGNYGPGIHILTPVGVQ